MFEPPVALGERGACARQPGWLGARGLGPGSCRPRARQPSQLAAPGAGHPAAATTAVPALLPGTAPVHKVQGSLVHES